MRLGLKLTAAFVFAALVPVGVTAYIARQVVGKRYEREHRKTLQETHEHVIREVKRATDRIVRKVGDLARDSDPKIGRVLVELAAGRLPADLQRELNEDGPRRMRHLGFDILLIVDGKGRVLSAGHTPGRVGMIDTLPGRLAAKLEGRAAFVRVPVEMRVGEQLVTVDKPAIVVAKKVMGPGAHVVVLGGLLLERAIWSRLPRKPGVAYLLREVVGLKRVLKAPPEGWARWKKFAQRSVALLGPDAKPAAQIVVAVSDEELVLARQRLDLNIMALAGSAFLFVVLVVGAFVIRQVTGRLGKVAAAAGAVAEGDLGVTIPPGARDEVGDLVRAFNRMTGNLQEARERLVQAERIAAWQEIARRIAHEIKNPLTPIQLSIETLRRSYGTGHPDFDEILDESTQTILEEVQRLRRIVTEFSEFARMPKPQLAPCDLNEVIRHAVGLHGPEGFDVAMFLEETLPEVSADREQLMQVLHNLLGNAREAVSALDEPHVEIHSFVVPGGVGFTVQDNGHGFDETVRQQIFTPYFTTKEGQGTGLGLAIVHRIVVEHGGSIEVAGSPGEGASFTLRLPVVND